MTFEEALALIEPVRGRLTMTPRPALVEWAHEAVRIFNYPPEAPDIRKVDAICAALADRLRTHMNGHLPPSAFRMLQAFAEAAPDASNETKEHFGLWCEATLIYLMRADREDPS